MPYSEDRVLVGVIRRKRDLNYLLREQWYRIPRGMIPDECPLEIMAFYVSGSAARHLGGSGIHYYAEKRGFELVRRADLVRDEQHHPRAAQEYLKLQLGAIHQKTPPITNSARRIFSFVWTTWDRFLPAMTIADLYRDGSQFVSPRRPH
jgi:hypothetical protein